MTAHLRTLVLGALLLVAGSAALAGVAPAQSDVLLRARAGSPLGDRFRVDSSGAFVAFGFVRDVGNTTGCAAQIPATGAGTRFMWHPCRGSLRFGRVPVGQTSWDDANMDDFTFAGGNQVRADGYGAFAYGDQVTVTSTVGVGFGSGVTVSGTAGFSAGASNVCSGFACTAIGYTVRAGGQGSVALGYRTTANDDYAVAIGYRASNNGRTGTMVMGDQSTTDSVRNQADNEFRARYNGGFRLRVSTAANGNTPGAGGNVGCDLTVAVPSWTCASSRTLKEGFAPVDGEDVLIRMRDVPVTMWTMIGDADRIRHLGPVAEDFHRGFALGLGATTIGMGDIDGVTFAAAQALERRTTELRAALEARDAEVAGLRGELETSRERQAALEAAFLALEARLSALEATP
jgi:trimeric autotransporter adhesin